MHNKRKSYSSIYILTAFLVTVFWLTSAGAFIFIRSMNLKAAKAAALSGKQKKELKIFLSKNYSEKKFKTNLKRKNCFSDMSIIEADSFIVVDASTGTVVAEKNAQKQIPPASITKLFSIYTAMKIMREKGLNINTTLNPPRQAWAQNIPAGSSLMFLGKNQIVSIEELIKGMSVVSGNDAASALAIILCGSEKEFVKKMNEYKELLQLKNTFFADASGLSEKNITTAEDIAKFSIQYIREYPENLKRFHSQTMLTYPQEHNKLMPQNSFTQAATNTLLKKIKGCDGLKTGFIYESGFNISLTAKRGGSRFIAVILGGKGNTKKEGIKIREKDGKKLIEKAFTNFATFNLNPQKNLPESIRVFGSNLPSKKSALKPICVCKDFSQKKITWFKDDTQKLKQKIFLPENLTAPIYAGQEIGKVVFYHEQTGEEVKTFSVIADRNIFEGELFFKKIDSIIRDYFQ